MQNECHGYTVVRGVHRSSSTVPKFLPVSSSIWSYLYIDPWFRWEGRKAALPGGNVGVGVWVRGLGVWII